MAEELNFDIVYQPVSFTTPRQIVMARNVVAPTKLNALLTFVRSEGRALPWTLWSCTTARTNVTRTAAAGSTRGFT